MNVVALARMDTFILLFYHRITFATVLLFGSLDAIRHGHVEMLGFGTALITGPSFLIIKFQINALLPCACESLLLVLGFPHIHKKNNVY